MKDLLALLAHLLTTIGKLLGPVFWSTESFDSPSPAEGAQRQTLVRAELLTRLTALFKTNHQLVPSLLASANPRPLNSAVTESCNLLR
jgi:hypothetical protein